MLLAGRVDEVPLVLVPLVVVLWPEKVTVVVAWPVAVFGSVAARIWIPDWSKPTHASMVKIALGVADVDQMNVPQYGDAVS